MTDTIESLQAKVAELQAALEVEREKVRELSPKQTNARVHGCEFEGWQCFHCGEIFTTVGAARNHFGAKPDAIPGCLLKVQVGAERGLLMKLRDTEDLLAETIARQLDEDTELHRQLHKMQARHSDALRNAEELGYERGLKVAAETARADRLQAAIDGMREAIEHLKKAVEYPMVTNSAEFDLDLAKALVHRGLEFGNKALST